MKNYLSTLLLTLAVLLGFHSAVAQDNVVGESSWCLVTEQGNWTYSESNEFTPIANSNLFYFKTDNFTTDLFKIVKVNAGSLDWGNAFYIKDGKKVEIDKIYDANLGDSGMENKLSAAASYGKVFIIIDPDNKKILLTRQWKLTGDSFGWGADSEKMFTPVAPFGKLAVETGCKCSGNFKVIYNDQYVGAFVAPSANYEIALNSTHTVVKDGATYGGALIFGDSFGNADNVRMTIDPVAVTVYTEALSTTPVDPAEGNTIVFFAGDEGQYMEYIKFQFYKGSELKKEVVVLDKGEDAATRFWDGRPYFFYTSVDNLAEYDGVDFYVEFKSDYVNAGHYNGDLNGKVTVKPASSTWYDKTNWSKYIYSPIEWEEGVSAHVSFQSYLTPKESHELYHAPRTHVYLCGNKEMSGDANRDWVLKDPVVVELSNGVGAYEIKSVNTESSNPPMFKASWLDYLSYCETVGGTRDVANNHKRAWATFNLGLIGGYEAVHVGDGQTDRSYFYIRRPRLYNNYSQSDWAMNTENVPNGQSVWLVIDSDPEFKSLTLLTFNPHPTINTLESHHEVVELPDGQLMNISDDENIWPNTTTGEVFNGKDSGKVRMAQANRFSAYAQISGIYKLMESTPGLEEAFKKEFNEKPLYNFYMINKDPELGRYDMSELTADMSIGDFAERLDWVSIPNITVGNEAALVVQGKFYVKEWSENDSYWPTAPATHGYDAAGFRSVPALKEIDAKYNAVTPRLERKPAFAEVYTDNGGYDQSTGHSGNWGLHLAAMMDFDDTDLMFYPDYEFEVNGKIGGVITHNEMEHVHHPSTWGLNDFVPYTDGEEYLEDTHNWSLLTKKYRGYNLSIENVIDGVSYTKINDIRLKAIFMFPFIVDTDAKIEKYTAPSAVARRAADVERASITWTPTMELKLEKTAHDMRYDMNGFIITGVEDVAAESVEYEAEYFNLQGVKMQAPVAPGVYIVRRGEKVTKEIIK